MSADAERVAIVDIVGILRRIHEALTAVRDVDRQQNEALLELAKQFPALNKRVQDLESKQRK